MAIKIEVVDLYHQANLLAESRLTWEENNLRFLAMNEEERLLEERRTPGITNKDRNRIEAEAFSKFPGSKDANDKYRLELEKSKLEVFSIVN